MKKQEVALLLAKTKDIPKDYKVEGDSPFIQAMSDINRDRCPQCNHLMDPHALITTKGLLGASDEREMISGGGIILCPHPGCYCYATWSVPGSDMPWIPTKSEIDQLRETLQRGHIFKARKQGEQ